MSSDSAGLPVGVELEDGRPVIARLDLGNAAFAEPLFRQTIELAPDALPAFTPYDDFRAALDLSCKPAGFIFHISRCGSTLVSQLLKEIADVRVYSEPPAISKALILAAQLPRREVRDLLEAVICALCSHPGRVFFKFSSWNVLEYSLFDEVFPDVPKLFVVRRPAEVLASIAKGPPGFVTRRDMFADVVRRRAGDRADALDDVEFAAVLLSVFLDAMAGGGNGPRRVLDYTELPLDAWQTLPRFFGIAEDKVDMARIENAARFHSKSYPERVPFRKQDESVTPADRALFERYAETWIGSRYEDLIVSRNQINHGGG